MGVDTAFEKRMVGNLEEGGAALARVARAFQAPRRMLMEITTLYDSEGRAVCYLDDDGTSIFLHDGSPVAWVSEQGIHTYGGSHLGWFEDGWVFNRAGDRVLFAEGATGGPARPLRQARPLRGARRVRPPKTAREARPSKPIRSLCWAAGDDPCLRSLTQTTMLDPRL